MIHVSRFLAVSAALLILVAPVLAAPVAVPGRHNPVPYRALALPPVTVGCEDDERYYDPPSEGETPSEGFFSTGLEAFIYKACEDKGQNVDPPGQPGIADAVEASLSAGIAHCGAYTNVWRVDCLSNELERMAGRLPNDSASRQAKADIRAAAAELRALAEQNADPAQPPVRRAVEVAGVRRATTRPITAVAPDRVAATNAAADAVISELSTTLLRSAAASPTTGAEFTRVAQAVDSTKVLLRSS